MFTHTPRQGDASPEVKRFYSSARHFHREGWRSDSSVVMPLSPVKITLEVPVPAAVPDHLQIQAVALRAALAEDCDRL